MQYEIGLTSRLGNRKTNQDRIKAVKLDQGVMLILGDGLGGREGGELAAQTLIDCLSKSIAKRKMPLQDPATYLEVILHKAHAEVLTAGKKQDPPVCPGTTAVVCLVQNSSVWWAHVGDSRLYLFRNGLPLYRTQDHSFVEKLYQEGHISLDKQQGHPMRSYVTRCVGLTREKPKVTISNEILLEEGDILLLCSDGLWEPLDDALLGSLIDKGPLNDTLNTMAERAEQTSYPNSDNTTALALRVISLQTIGKQPTKTNSAVMAKKKTNNEEDALDEAIEEIQRALKDYENEVKD